VVVWERSIASGLVPRPINTSNTLPPLRIQAGGWWYSRGPHPSCNSLIYRGYRWKPNGFTLAANATCYRLWWGVSGESGMSRGGSTGRWIDWNHVVMRGK
jgi:hypothetical protein